MLVELATVDAQPLQHPLARRDPDLIGERGDRLHLRDRDPPTIRTCALDEPDPIVLGHDQRTAVASELELARMDRRHGRALPPSVPYPSPRSRPSRSRMPCSFADSIRGHARRFRGSVPGMTMLLIGARLPPALTRPSTEAPSMIAAVLSLSPPLRRRARWRAPAPPPSSELACSSSNLRSTAPPPTPPPTRRRAPPPRPSSLARPTSRSSGSPRITLLISRDAEPTRSATCDECPAAPRLLAAPTCAASSAATRRLPPPRGLGTTT